MKKEKKDRGMTKGEIYAYFAEKFEMARKDVKVFFEELADLAVKQAKRGFQIPGIGKLILKDSKARMGRNPRTGEAIKIKASKKVKFRVAAACKRTVLSMIGKKSK